MGCNRYVISAGWLIRLCRPDVSNSAPLADISGVVKRSSAARGHAKTGPEVDEEAASSSSSSSGQCLSPPTSYYVDTDQVQQYWCRPPTVVNGTVVDGEYNEGGRAYTVKKTPYFNGGFVASFPYFNAEPVIPRLRLYP